MVDPDSTNHILTGSYGAARLSIEGWSGVMCVRSDEASVELLGLVDARSPSAGERGLHDHR
jgi:hypothetical protein